MCVTTTRTGHIWGWRKTHRRVGQWRTVPHWETGFALPPEWVACTILRGRGIEQFLTLARIRLEPYSATVDKFFALESMPPLTLSFRHDRLANARLRLVENLEWAEPTSRAEAARF